MAHFTWERKETKSWNNSIVAKIILKQILIWFNTTREIFLFEVYDSAVKMKNQSIRARPNFLCNYKFCFVDLINVIYWTDRRYIREYDFWIWISFIELTESELLHSILFYLRNLGMKTDFGESWSTNFRQCQATAILNRRRTKHRVLISFKGPADRGYLVNQITCIFLLQCKLIFTNVIQA